MGSVEQRQLLADVYALIGTAIANAECVGGTRACMHVTRAREIEDRIAAALREQPEARGVVDAIPEAVVDAALRAWFDDPEGAGLDGGPEHREWRTRMLAALTAAQRPVQEGGGEVAAWMTPESIAHLAKQNGVAKVDAWNCASGSERVPVYTAPPSAPVGDFEDWLDRDWPLWRNNPDNPIIARLRRAWDAALTQQPAQAAPGDGLGWEENVSYLLDRCPHAVRVREGGGPESLVQSLIVTFMNLEKLATGSLHGLHHPTGAEAMTPDVALLPCPFCGGRAKSKSEFVRCVECGAQMNFGDEDGLDSIISSWNRRSDAALASAQAREEELRAEVERLAALHVGHAAQVFTLTSRSERLAEALRYALNQNEHDMVLTGDEIRAARAALSTNAATQTGETT